jgi:DNA-binding beta-propeller fold protein YncE
MKNGLIFAGLLLALGACGSDEYGTAGDPGGGNGGNAGDAGAAAQCFSSNECPTGWTCSDFGTCVPPAPGSPDGGGDPAEVEVELSPPTHSDRFVYVAMSELDALARIDGMSLEVSSIPVGDQPEVLEAIPVNGGVVVLDRNNGTVSIVRPSGASDDTRVVPTLPNMNRLSVDPTGTYALAWFDLRQAALDAGGLAGVGQIGSFQDVTVIRLTQDSEHSVDLTVGFRPREIEFDAAGSRAFVITDDGVSIIELADVIAAGPSIVAPVSVTVDPQSDPVDIEVNVVASGEFAVVRERLKNEMRVLRLAEPNIGLMNTIVLPAEPTDVDLAPNGMAAYAVLRESGDLAILDLSAGLPTDANLQLIDLGTELVGSLVLSPDGAQAVLFTNASPVERVTLLDFNDAANWRSYNLRKSVRSLGYDPTGASLIVTHSKGFGDPFENGIDFDEFINRSYGYSILDVASGFDKLEITTADPGAFSFSTDTPRAYVLLDGGDADGAVAETHIIELDTGVVRVRAMNSPPETIGILPDAGMAFINQRHALGRVSFIDVVSDAMRTVTGFDLNSRIVD